MSNKIKKQKAFAVLKPNGTIKEMWYGYEIYSTKKVAIKQWEISKPLIVPVWIIPRRVKK